MSNIRVNTLTFATFVAFSFIVCVVTALLLPAGYTMAPFLESILPGFKWISGSAFFLGLAESAVIGAYIGLVFTPIYNFFSKTS